MGEAESKSDSTKYFVQVGEKVKGPFTIAQLRVLRDRGSLGGFHRISSDRIEWKQAKDLEELFAKKTTSRKLKATVIPKDNEDNNTEPPIAVKPLDPAPGDEEEWFYLDSNDQAKGPVNRLTLESMCSRGKLGLESTIWSSELPTWTEISNTKFASLCRDSISSPTERKSTKKTNEKAELASPGQRLGAAMLDGLLYLLVVALGWCIAFFLSVTFIVGASSESETNDPDIIVMAGLIQLLVVALFWIVFLVIQTILIATTGQTISKKLVGIRIVTVDGDAIPGFGKGVVLRSFLPGVIYGVPGVGIVFLLVDLCYIFREDHRCVHDHMAGTRVVRV